SGWRADRGAGRGGDCEGCAGRVDQAQPSEARSKPPALTRLYRLSAFGFRLSAFGFRRSAFGFRLSTVSANRLALGPAKSRTPRAQSRAGRAEVRHGLLRVTERLDVIHNVPNLGVVQAPDIAFHIWRRPVVNHGEKIAIRRSVDSLRFGEIRGLRAGCRGAVALAFGSVALDTQPLIRALAGGNGLRRRGNRVLHLRQVRAAAFLRFW